MGTGKTSRRPSLVIAVEGIQDHDAVGAVKRGADEQATQWLVDVVIDFDLESVPNVNRSRYAARCEDARAVLRRRACHRGDQARVIDQLSVVGAQATGLTWNSLTISAAVLAGGAVVLLLIYAMSLVSVPLMVFFQAYTLHFFGSRYPLLGEQLALTSRPLNTAFPPSPEAAAPLPAS